MQFGLLGPLAVWNDRGEPVTIPGRKVRALLADLLVHRGSPVSADRLVEDLWGSAAPADPASALHVRVSQLRRALAGAEAGGRELVVSQAPGYLLRTGPESLDAARFEATVDRAQGAADPWARAGLLDEALTLWRGRALADFADEEFAESAAARWEERRLAAVEARAEARLELGEHGELVGELGELVALHPFRERLRAAHMRALHRSGRTSEALDGFADLRRLLADELGLDPGPDLAALHRAVLAGDPSEYAPAPPRRNRPTTNLPAPVADLVGREHALRRIGELLTGGRLVTLTGPGGVGKTSAALTAARSLLGSYPDGAWLVDLTSWDGSGDPAGPVLSALSIPESTGDQRSERERLAAVLRDRRTLLVLDNCEHVVGSVADLLTDLLPAAGEVRVLATSREPLRLRGETRLDLEPLDVPDTDDPARLAPSPAVRLFLARSGLEPDDRTVVGAAEVCRRLDGIPLALELAATRAAALGVHELAARLRVPQDRFGLLGTGPRDAPARQRTLAAVIDWSWRLLSESERTMLRRMAVHSSGCTLESAEAVSCPDAAPGSALETVAGLVDRSLVARGDGLRFRLLESVAAYALERLQEAGEEAELRRRHADHYLALAERAEARLRGPEQREWLRRMDAEASNLRRAFDTFRRDGAAEPALRLASALTWYWNLRGRLTEARRSLEAALALPGEVSAAVRAQARAWQTGLAIRQGCAGPERVPAVLDDLEPVEPIERARVEWFLASSIIDFGDEAATVNLLDRALDGFRSEGDRWGEAAVLTTRAMLAHLHGDLDGLERAARRAAELFGELGDDWGVLQADDWLIGLADMTGDHAEGARIARADLRLAEDLGFWPDVAGRLSWLAWLSVQVGDCRGAVEHAERAKDLTAEQGLRAAEVFATIALAFAARRGGRLDLAEKHLRWLLATARDQGTDEGRPPYLSMVLIELGFLTTQRGDPAGALERFDEGFAASDGEGADGGKAWALVGMAEALALEGWTEAAARLLGAADSARRGSGHVLSASDAAELDRIGGAVRDAEPGYGEAFAAGAALTPERARSLVERTRRPTA